MRYEFRENHDGKDLFDEHEGYYMNEEECLEKLNEQDAEIELLKKLRKQDKQYEDDRQRLYALPNFDAKVFRAISGIDVGKARSTDDR